MVKIKFTTKVGNTRTALKAELEPVEAFANVKEVWFSMSSLNFKNIIHRTVNIWDDPNATVVFTEAELKNPGTYYGEFHVEYDDGKVEKFPSEGYISIIINRATGKVGE